VSDLVGIVLMGGKSSRMHQDKSLLLIDEIPLYNHAVRKISPFCSSIFLSVNPDQANNYTYEFPIIIDKTNHDGPLMAIYHLLESLQSNVLVMACDMLGVKDIHISTLLESKWVDKNCTCYFDDDKNIYEPLLSIWTYHSSDRIGKFINDGGRSIQKFLTELHVPKIKNPSTPFINVNTTEDWQKLKSNILIIN
jgi:molybdenum cofactor guanylyltransferase